MIRVFRAESGESLARARDGTPRLSGTDAAAIRVQLVSTNVFDRAEAAAIERAIAEIEGGDADIVVAPGGSIYRTFPVRTAPAPSDEVPPAPVPRGSTPSSSLAQDRSARILVAAHDASILRVGELLSFLGYDSHALVLDDGGLESYERLLDEKDPHVVILAPSALEGLFLPRAKEQGCVVLSLGRAQGVQVDASIPTPISSETLAPLLDPLVAKARAARGR